MERIQTTATFPSIGTAGLAEFKRVAAEALAVTKTEPGTLQYDWFFSADEAVCVVRETYADSDAVLAHLGNVGPLLAPLIELAGGVKLEVFGSPSQQLLDATAAFQPTVYGFSQGM